MKTARKAVAALAVDSSAVSSNKPADTKTGTAELLFRSARQMDLRPVWIVPNGLFAISHCGAEHYINFARSPLNTHTSASLAKNKHATRLILERHGLPNIPFLRPRTMREAVDFLNAHTKIIAKPVNGAGARDIHIVSTPAELEGLKITHYILEKYVLGKEMRYLVLQGRVIGVHQSEYGISVDEHRDLQRISYPELAWDKSLTKLALRISQALGLRFAAVDYLVTDTGDSYVLEVNSTPGLKWFHAPSSGPIVDVARQFLEAIIADTAPTAHLAA